jgi:hypothetical protein
MPTFFFFLNIYTNLVLQRSVNYLKNKKKKCKELGLAHVHLEGDAKVVIDAVNCELADRSLLGLVIEDIKVGGAAGVGPVADDICEKRWEQGCTSSF